MEDQTLTNEVRSGASTADLGPSALAGMASEASSVKNVVLVHGAFADGSGYKALYRVLSQNGYQVTVVQNPLTSLEDDVDATTLALDKQDGPTILAGHSW